MRVLALLFTILLTGCSLLVTPQKIYTPPEPNPDNAKVRFYGNPQGYHLIEYQKVKEGEPLNYEHYYNSGDLVPRKQTLISTNYVEMKHIGLPKITGKEYDDQYYETVVPSNIELMVGNYNYCNMTFSFVTKKAAVYEVRFNTTDKVGYCVIYLNEIVYDKTNGIYVAKKVNFRK